MILGRGPLRGDTLVRFPTASFLLRRFTVAVSGSLLSFHERFSLNSSGPSYENQTHRSVSSGVSWGEQLKMGLFRLDGGG